MEVLSELLTLLVKEHRWPVEVFSGLPAFFQRSPSVIGGFPSQGPMVQGFTVYFIVITSKPGSKLTVHMEQMVESSMMKRHDARVASL